MAYLPGLGRELLKAAANAPFLEREEEKQLALAWRDQGDRHALHKLTSAHMRLVIAIAAKFRH
jgi:RNA polymerase sigma-32 factor